MMLLVLVVAGHMWVLDYNLTPDDCWPQVREHVTCILE